MDDHQLAFRFNALELKMARLEKKVDFILEQLKLNYAEEPEEIGPEFKQVVELLKKGNMMGAIQAYRMVTGAPLEEAKTAVQELNLKVK